MFLTSESTMVLKIEIFPKHFILIYINFFFAILPSYEYQI